MGDRFLAIQEVAHFKSANHADALNSMSQWSTPPESVGVVDGHVSFAPEAANDGFELQGRQRSRGDCSLQGLLHTEF